MLLLAFDMANKLIRPLRKHQLLTEAAPIVGPVTQSENIHDQDSFPMSAPSFAHAEVSS